MRAPPPETAASAPPAAAARRRLGPKAAKYLACSASALQDKLAYAPDVAGQVISYGIFVFVFINLWAAVFAGKPGIAGYTRGSAVWYFIVAELAAFSQQGNFAAVSDDVKSGAIAYGLGRPYSYVLFQYARSAGEMVLPQILIASLGILMGTLSAGPLPLRGPLHLPAVVLSLFLGSALNFFLQTAISLTAFWVEENSVFFWIYQKFILVIGTLMPIEFLPAGFQGAARLLPFSSVAYAPARLAAAFSPGEAPAILGTQALWVIAAAGLAFFVFSRGVKHVSVQGG